MITQYLLAASAALIIGASKAGLKGLGVIVVALLALAYGAKASTGILVPLLLAGDILAVVYFNRHARWTYLFKFMPAMFVGVIVAAWFGKDLPEEIFKNWMAVIIMITVIFMIGRDFYTKKALPNTFFISGSLGFLAGFATMLGNLAGGFSNLFFLGTRISKNEIIGTGAWLYLIVNFFKVPFHVFSWGTINSESLKIDLVLLPITLLGFFIGLRLIGLFSEENYRRFLLVVTLIGAILIFL